MSKKKKYALRHPLYAGGVRLQEARTSSIRNWWAKRWNESIASKDLAGRAARAHNYAMTGQVVEISPERAVVQGLRKEPYRVKLVFRKPEGEARARIVAALKAEPMMVSRLLSGDLPTEVEGLFKAEGFDLFPGGKLGEDVYDVTTSCTCPDYANPCKHSLAALIVLGEEVAWRPWRLLEFRGISMEELIA